MKLSVFTTVTRPKPRGDNVDDALRCYHELADEVVIVNGLHNATPVFRDEKKVIVSPWPKEFSWPLIGHQFQRGYEESNGDWVIHADLDFLFHEEDFEAIRQACIDNNDQPAFSMLKRQFILPDRFNLKSRLVVAVNKGKFGDRIRFDSGGDLCQPSLDGKYIEPGTVPDLSIPIWNYEKLLKTKRQIAEDQGRMERAYSRHFLKYQMGSDGTNEGAFAKWLAAQIGKFNKPQEKIPLSDHPKYVQETIKNLKPEQWGYSGFGELGVNSYVS